MRAAGVVASLVILLPAPAAARAVLPAAATPLGGPVTFTGADGVRIEVAGAPYRGTVEVRPGAGGLTVVNELDLESYVMGLDEVPPDWPAEALKAQAVAARTYALWEREKGAWAKSGYDVCATTSCQVYRGASVESGSGTRWVEAVRATAGEVLLYQGKPALTRYHASSGGRTLDGEVVYPKSGALPYLRGIDDPQDEVSPLYRWTVTFPSEVASAVAQAAFGTSGPVGSIDVDERARTVSIRAGDRDVRMSTSRFRSQFGRKAARLYPDRYPSRRADGRRMPETLPSSRFTVARADDGYVVSGRGYGHGVGMSQWGAKGRAERGDDYRTILGAYYTGLKPKRWTGADRIRVGISSRDASVGIGADGTFRVTAGSDVLAASTVGAWTVAARTSRTLDLTPPRGHDLPLVLSGVSAPAGVTTDGTEHVVVVEIRFVLPKSAKVTGVVSRNGRRAASASRVFAAGTGRLRIAAEPSAVPPGVYAVRLTASDGRDTSRKDLRLRVVGRASRWPWMALVAVAVAVLVVLLRRRSVHSAGPPHAAGASRQSSAMPVRGQESPGPHG